MANLVPFQSWPEVLDYARSGGLLYYQAPMDQRPTQLRPGRHRKVPWYDVRARTIKIWPGGSVGRGRQRTHDPFTADSAHLDRSSRPSGMSENRRTGGHTTLQEKAVEDLHEFLEKVVLLREDRVEVNGVIDLESSDPVRVGIMVDVTGYGPHLGAMFVQQYGHIDEVLEGAFEILEQWTEDHHPGGSTETFDGRVFKVSPQGFIQAIKGTPADAFITEDDVAGNEEDNEDEDEDEEDDEDE